MSKHETPMTRWYWQHVLKQGTLIEEYVAVDKAGDDSSARRLMDGLVIMSGPFEISDDVHQNITDKDVVIIQSKNKRLGMSLMGQTLFSRGLILKKKPKSVRSVALCREDDKEMHALLLAHPGMEVYICPAEVK